MKFLINENRLIDFIKDRFGFNLNEFKYEITTWSELENIPIGRCFNKHYILERLNKYGPIYIIDLSSVNPYRQDKFFLFQKNLDSNRYLIFNNNCDGIHDGEIFEIFGLNVLGLSWKDILDLYK